MGYNEALAARVRRALSSRSEVAEKPMFGGLTFMVAGNMCCGVIKDELMIRLAPRTVLATLDSPQIRICDFTRRPMPGFFIADAVGCVEQKDVDRWVGLALKHALSLPPK